MDRRSLLAWVTLPLLLVCGSVEAQEGAPATFHQTVDVRVVNVDLYVTDKKGRPVTDLGPDDFILLVDGREVDLEYFSSPSTGSRSLAKRVLDDVEGDDAKSVAVPADDLLLVIYFDGYWLTPQDRSRVLDDVAGFVKAQANAGLRFVVVSHGPPLEVLAPPTRDSEAVLEAISAMSDEPTRGLERARARRSAYDSIRGIWEIYTDVPVQLGCGGPCECGWREMLGLWEVYAQNASHRIGVSHSGMRELLSMLSGLEGRKVVLYVGSGYGQRPGLDLLQYLMDLCPEYQSEFAAYLLTYDESRNLLALAAAANSKRVTFYPLDAGGLRAAAASSVDLFDARLRPSALVGQIERANLQAPFALLADETGGQAILDANQPLQDLRDLESDFRHVYSLGFTPRGEPDGETHTLRVELRAKRRGVRLRYRRSFVDHTPDTRMIDRAISAMAFREESNPLGVEAELGGITKISAKEVEVPVRIAVPTRYLTLVPDADEKLTGRFRVFLAAHSAGREWTPWREQFFDLTEADGEEPLQRITVTMNLEPGDYTVGVGVRDENAMVTSYLVLEMAGARRPFGGGVAHPE